MANNHWIGGAPPTFDIWDLTVALTWAAGDVARVTIANIDLLLTVQTSIKDDIALQLIEAINNADTTTNLLGGETRNFGGQSQAQFAEIVASAHPTSTTKVRLTTRQAGIPVTITAGETTAGDGTLTVAHTQTATGPEYLDNADNWSTGTLPADNDHLYFDTGNVSVKYGLTWLRDNARDCDWTISGDWTGEMGLPTVNVNGGYAEYRQRPIQYRGGAKTIRFVAGQFGNVATGACYIDLQDQADLAIHIESGRGNNATPGIVLNGADASTLTNELRMYNGAGFVSVEPDDAPTSTSKYASFATILVGTPGAAANDLRLVVGQNARVDNGGTTLIETNNGLAEFNAAGFTTANVRGGILSIFDKTAVGDTEVYHVFAGATLRMIDANLSTGDINCYGGTIDCSGSTQVNGLTNVRLYAGSTLNDPVGSCSDFEAVGCTLSQLGLTLPPNRHWAFSSTATP